MFPNKMHREHNLILAMSDICCIFALDLRKRRYTQYLMREKNKILFGQFERMLYLCSEFERKVNMTQCLIKYEKVSERLFK